MLSTVPSLGTVPTPRIPATTGRALHDIVRRLRGAYEFDWLGNLEDPLDELIYIVLSTRTRELVFQRTFKALKKRFPTWDQVARSRLRTVERLLRPAGLSRKKASWLRDLLREIGGREGKISLERLSSMATAEAEAYLTSLPGIGLKTARCVLMYSLHRQVLPVDVNVRRLLERLEVIPPGVHYYDVHDLAQGAVFPELRSDLHIYAVIHGRSTCLPRSPRCGQCVLTDVCPYPLRQRTEETSS